MDPKDLQRQPSGTPACEEATLQNRCFLLHEMVHFGLWRGPGEARSRPRGAEETLSEVGRATEAEGRRPRGTQRGAKGAPRARKGTPARSDRPSFGALGPVGGLLDMIYRIHLID